MHLHIISGASKGMGRGLAGALLKKDHFVLNISRSELTLPNVYNLCCDLTSVQNIQEMLIEKLNLIYREKGKMNFCSLVNNAAQIEPIGNIENLNERQISEAIHLNLAVPIQLTSAFLKFTASLNVERVIINVSSGVAKNPKKSWGVYCISKSGLETLSEILNLEFQEHPDIKVINFEPGIMDTDMQGEIRVSQSPDFFERQRFIDFKVQNQLLSANKVGEVLAEYMLNAGTPSNSFISIYDLLSKK